MAENPRRRTKGAERQMAGGDTAGDVVKDILLFALPGGALVRVAAGATKAIKAIRAMRGAKQIKNPTAAQISRAKPPSAVTQQPKVAPPKPAGSAVVKRGDRRDVRSPGTQTTRTDRVIDGDAPRTMRNITPPRSKPKSLPGSSRVQSQGSKVKTATAALNVASMQDKKDNVAGIPKAPAKEKTTEGGPGPRPSAQRAVPKSKPEPKSKRVDLGTVKERKVTPAKTADRRAVPDTKKIDSKGRPKVIDAGSNTGFGIKGNQFVGGPEERAVMMKYYGGTGSAAAKAAQEGKQGRLKELGMDSLRDELREAKKKRFEREQKNMRKGGAVKKAIGSMDYRQGGTLISVQDRMKGMK